MWSTPTKCNRLGLIVLIPDLCLLPHFICSAYITYSWHTLLDKSLVLKIFFCYFLKETFVVVIQKRYLNETLLLSIQNKCFLGALAQLYNI